MLPCTPSTDGAQYQPSLQLQSRRKTRGHVHPPGTSRGSGSCTRQDGCGHRRGYRRDRSRHRHWQDRRGCQRGHRASARGRRRDPRWFLDPGGLHRGRVPVRRRRDPPDRALVIPERSARPLPDLVSSMLILLATSVALIAEGENKFNPIDLATGGNFFWTLLSFAVSVPLIWKLVMGPVTRALEERDSRASAAIVAAEKASADAARMKGELERALSEAQVSAAKLLAEARERAEA